MKSSLSLVSVIIFIVSISCNSLTNRKLFEIERVILEYDSLLSSLQHEYRIWLKNEDSKTIGIFDPESISDLDEINDNIKNFLDAKDSVFTYLERMMSISRDYGYELKSFIKNEDAKTMFHAKWITYQEEVAIVMNYDIETIKTFIDVFWFLRNNFENYVIEDEHIYFNSEDLQTEYINLLSKITDPGIEIKQLEKRSQTINDFNDAIGFVKAEVKRKRKVLS